MRINPCPQVRWVPVVDSAGHRHMEMRWSMPSQPTAQPATAPSTLRAACAAPASSVVGPAA